MASLDPAANRAILLAEDEEGDVLMFQLAMQKAKLSHRLFVVRDGREAIDYLSGSPPYSDRAAHPLPELLVLDIKMPRMTGFEVISWLNTRPELSTIPAVILSSSSYQEDALNAEKLGARQYYVKPLTIGELAKLLEGMSALFLPSL